MNLFRGYRYDSIDYVVVNLKYCFDNYQLLFDFVRYYLRDIIIISDHFESIDFNNYKSDHEKKVLTFISENLDKIKICDIYRFNEIGFPHYIKNGLESSGNLPFILETLNSPIQKETNFLFLSNRIKSFRINLFNFLIYNGYHEKVCIKFNNPPGDFSEIPLHIFKDVSNTTPIIKIPYRNKLFTKIYGNEEPIFDSNSLKLYDTSDLYEAIKMCSKSRFFISTESAIGSYCFSEKTLIPFLGSSIPIILMSHENYDLLRNFGFYLDGFFIKNSLDEFESSIKFILNMNDEDLMEFYKEHSYGIYSNFRMLKKIIT